MSLNGDGHNIEAEALGELKNIAIGRMRERYYIGEVLELVGYIGDLKLKWHSLLFQQILNKYVSYK